MATAGFRGRVFKDVLKPVNRFMFRKEGNVLFNDPLNTFYVSAAANSYTSRGALAETRNRLYVQIYFHFVTI